METKIVRVFYDIDNLPYKDKECSVHFPVIGSAFLGASNTTKIRFYYSKIGNEDVTWVSVAKLPNSKQGSKVLSKSSDEFGDYAELQLSNWYTQAKGDVFIALQGYQGGVEVELVSGVYQIVGTPTIQTTGAIKLAINYAPIGDSADYNDEFTTYQQILALVGEIDDSKQDKAILVLNSVGDSFSITQSNFNYINKFPSYMLVDNQLYVHCEDDDNYLWFRRIRPNYVGTNGTTNMVLREESIQVSKTETTTRPCYKVNHNTNFYNKSQSDTFLAAKEDLSNKVTTLSALSTDTQYPSAKAVWDNLSALQNYLFTYYYTKTITDVSFAHSIDLTIDSNYDLVVKLLDMNGNVLSSDDIDLPLESIIVSATYYNSYTYGGTTYEKVLVITLATTDVPTIIPVGDLVSGLVSTSELATALLGYQPLIDSSHMLSADLVDDTSTTNKFVTTSEKETWSAKQDLLVSGTNIKTINGTTILGSGNIDYDDTLSDSSTNAVQNKILKGIVDSLSNRLSVLEESIIDDATLSYTYLSQSAIPTNVDSNPIIESAGMDCIDIKGNSVVVNQQITPSASLSLNIGSNGYANFNLFGTKVKVGDKVLVWQKSTWTDANITSINCYNGAGSYAFSVTTSNTFAGNISTIGNVDLCFFRINGTASTTVSFNFIGGVINLTQWYGSNDLIPNDLTAQDFFDTFGTIIPSTYNSGTLISSKPNAIVSHGFNIWDEQWEVGTINTTTGANAGDNTRIRSKNYIPIIPNTIYYYLDSVTSRGRACFYDINKNFISSMPDFPPVVNVRTFETPSNAYYMKFSPSGVYGTTYKHDICINISNASLNGTYRPYIAPINYPLSLPVMRSSGSVQDDVSKVRIGVVNLGTLTWGYDSGATNPNFYSTGLSSLIKSPSSNGTLFIGICSKYDVITRDSLTGGTKGIACATNGIISVRDTSYTDADTFKTAMNNVYLYYELATPTDQPTITLPDNISFQKGGSLEVTYDSTDNTPADFDFEVAVYKPIQ